MLAQHPNLEREVRSPVLSMGNASTDPGRLTFDLGDGVRQFLGLVRLPLMLLLKRLQCHMGLLQAFLFVEELELKFLRSITPRGPELSPCLLQLGRVCVLFLAGGATLLQLAGLHFESVDADHQLVSGQFWGAEGAFPSGRRIVISSTKSTVVIAITFSIISTSGLALGLGAAAFGQAFPLLPG